MRRRVLILILLLLFTIPTILTVNAQGGDDLIPQARAAARDARSRDPSVGSLLTYTWTVVGTAFTDALGCQAARPNNYINPVDVYQLDMIFQSGFAITYFVSADTRYVVPCDSDFLQLPPIYDPDAPIGPTPIVGSNSDNTSTTDDTTTDTTTDTTDTTDSTPDTDDSTTDDTTSTDTTADSTASTDSADTSSETSDTTDTDTTSDTENNLAPTVVVPQSDARLPAGVVTDNIEPPAIDLPADRTPITVANAANVQLVQRIPFPAPITAIDIGTIGDLVVNVYGQQGTASTFVYGGLQNRATLEVVNTVHYNGFSATYRKLTPSGEYFLETERNDDGDTELVLYDVATGESHVIEGITGRFHLFDIDISDDNDSVIVAYEHGRADNPEPGFALIHVDDEEVIELDRPDDTTITAVAIDPEGTHVAAFDGFGIVYVIDVETGLVDSEFEVDFSGAGHLEFSHDGRFLAASGYGPTVHLYDVVTEEDHLLDAPYAGITDRPDLRVLEFSPDSSLLAVGGLEFPLAANTGKDIKLYDVATFELVGSVAGANYLEDLAFSPDGSLMFAIDDFTLYIFGVAPPSSQATETPAPTEDATDSTDAADSTEATATPDTTETPTGE